MKITNTHLLPDVLVKAASNQRLPTPDSISCTELIDSPLIRRLKIEHWNDLEADVSEMVWALTGTALHKMIEDHGAGDSEVKLETEFNGIKITGTCDHLTADRITDWKTTSVWSVMLGGDWLEKCEQQLNIYQWLNYRMTGKRIEALSIVAIFRDWRRSESLSKPDYPQRNVMEFRFQAWPLEKVEQFINERLEYHADLNYVCSLKERWAKAESWAVMKEGRKSAVRVFDTQSMAVNLLMDLGNGHTLQHRAGECTRCAEYCPVRNFCRYKTE